MRKWLFSFAAVLAIGVIGYAGLAFYALQASSFETNASCAIGNSGTYIPRSACRWYLNEQLSGEGDDRRAQSVLHLAIGAYPTDGERALEIMELALSEGARVNGYSPVTGYPPLHEAVLLNEPQLAEFLIQRGADPEVEDRNKGLTAHELLSAIKDRNPDQNLSEIAEIIQRD